MNRYRKGAQVERDAVNQHIKNGAIFAGRLAGSKCKGKLKVDVIAVYFNKSKHNTTGKIYFEQYKKGKASVKQDEKKFKRTKFPVMLDVYKKFIKVK